jgi:hypothetical protein
MIIRPSLILKAYPETPLPGFWNHARTGSRVRTNRFGVVETLGAGILAHEYHPITGEHWGLTVLPARTNSFTYSQDFTSATGGWSWNNLSAVNATSITAPDGTLTGNLVSDDTTNANHAFYKVVSSVTVNTNWGIGIWAKAGPTLNALYLALSDNGANALIAQFRLDNGTVFSTANNGTASGAAAAVVPYPNGWYLCVLQGTAASSGSTLRGTFRLGYWDGSTVVTAYAGTPSGMYLWGAHLSQGLWTGYIPTTDSQVTHTADTLTTANLDWWNASGLGPQNTLFCEFRTPPIISGTHTVFSLDDTTADNRIYLHIQTGTLRAVVVTGGSTVADLDLGSASGDTLYKVAFRVQADNFAACLNGGTVQTDTSGGIPAVTTLRLGTNYENTNVLRAPIRSLYSFPRGLSDADLQEITA